MQELSPIIGKMKNRKTSELYRGGLENDIQQDIVPVGTTGGIYMTKTPLTRIVTNSHQIQTLHCMMLRMIMIAIMKMVDMNK